MLDAGQSRIDIGVGLVAGSVEDNRGAQIDVADTGNRESERTSSAVGKTEILGKQSDSIVDRIEYCKRLIVRCKELVGAVGEELKGGAGIEGERKLPP